MIFRIINACYRKLLLPFYVASAIKKEQKHEEKLVMDNVPSGALSPLTKEEKEQVNLIYAPVMRGTCGGG